MGWSSLTDKRLPVSNYSSRNGRSICKITPHHMAGNLSLERCAEVLQDRDCSANYGIDSDGNIACFVDEDDRSWASYSYENDSQAITIECANDEYGGDWHISDACFESLINLCVDICQRYGFRLEYDETPNGSLTRHNMFYATVCPGPYLQSRFYDLMNEVNKRLDGNIKYRAHVEDYGWQNWKHDGQPAGTTGSGKRLEALQIDAPFEIQAKAHIQDIGWVDYGIINKDTIIGTTGESKRLEDLCFKGDFKYRVHIQENGWTPWTNADEIATLGTVGQKLRIECIEIKPL
jgi:hypothetical protein